MMGLLWLRNRNKNSDWACPKCGKLNDPKGRFCEFCGQPRHKSVVTAKNDFDVLKMPPKSLKCSVCGADCKEGTAFCDNCGASLKKTSSTSAPVQSIAPESRPKETTVRCVHCGTMNPEINRFCEHCSEEIRIVKESAVSSDKRHSTIALFCPECGARHTDDTVFCNECGANIAIGR